MELILEAKEILKNIIINNSFGLYKISSTVNILLCFENNNDLFDGQKQIQMEKNKISLNTIFYSFTNGIFIINKQVFVFNINDTIGLKNIEEFLKNLTLFTDEDNENLKTFIQNNDLVESLKIVRKYEK